MQTLKEAFQRNYESYNSAVYLRTYGMVDNVTCITTVHFNVLLFQVL